MSGHYSTVIHPHTYSVKEENDITTVAMKSVMLNIVHPVRVFHEKRTLCVCARARV